MKFKINRGPERYKPQALEYGELIGTHDGNLYIGDEQGTPLKMTDILFVDTLPAFPLENKVYIEKTTRNAVFLKDGKLEKIVNKKDEFTLNVLDYGVTGLGVEDETEKIQSIIDSLNPTEIGEGGMTIWFPPGKYLVSEIHINKNIRIVGAGRATLFLRNPQAYSDAVFAIEDGGKASFHYELRDFFIHGQKTLVTGTGLGEGNGLIIKGTYSTVIRDIYTIENNGYGIKLDLDSLGVPPKNMRILDTWTYGAGKNNIYVHPKSVDIHIEGGDHGAAYEDNIFLGAPSSKITNAVVWGSKTGNGILVPAGAPSVQITNCNVEGNRKHGIEVLTSHVFINGNKIYCNAQQKGGTVINPKDYSGIHVSGGAKNVTIASNIIYAGVGTDNESTEHKYAIHLEDHTDCSIFSNAIRYNGKGGTKRDNNTLVVGLNGTDTTDYSWTNSFVDTYLAAAVSIPSWAWTKLPLVKGLDREAEYTNTSNQFVPKNYGIYEFNSSVMFDEVPDGTLILLSVFINGTERGRMSLQRVGTNTTKWHMASGAATFELNAGDVVDVRCQSSAAVKTFSGAAYTRFTVKLIK